MSGYIGLKPEDLVKVPTTKSKPKAKSNGNSPASIIAEQLTKMDGIGDWSDLALLIREQWVNGKVSMGFFEGVRDMEARARAQRASYVGGAVRDTQTREQSVSRAEQLLDKAQLEMNDAEAAMRFARNEERVLNHEINAQDSKIAAAARAGLIEIREHKLPGLQLTIKEASRKVEQAQQHLRFERGDVPRYGGKASYGSAED
jgi:hypothetical protein